MLLFNGFGSKPRWQRGSQLGCTMLRTRRTALGLITWEWDAVRARQLVCQAVITGCDLGRSRPEIGHWYTQR